MLTWLKKKIVIQSMEKKKKANPFDIEYSDNYQLPNDATSDVNNSHYFFAFDFDTKECVYFRSARRGADAFDEVWLVYRDALGNVYRSNKDHYSKDEKNPTIVSCLEAGKRMKFTYDGFVRRAKLTTKGYVVADDSMQIPLKLEGIFVGTTPIFEFTTHMDSSVTAAAIAKEKFDKDFQNAFNAIYQIHYEQGGKITLNIDLNNEKSKLNDFHSIRDHSYGKRNWNFFDRYIWNIVILENGEFVHSSMMRYPVLKELQAGFIISKDIIGLKSSTSMDDIPVVGTTPNEYKVEVVFANEKKSVIEASLDFVCPFYFENDFNVNEGVCDFTVDGVRGKGIGEFAFNHDKNRWSR